MSNPAGTKTFAQALTEAMEERGLTRRQVSETMEVGMNTVYCWVNGVRVPPRPTRRRLGVLLYNDPMKFLGDF